MSVLYVYVTGPQGAGKSRFLKSLGGSETYWVDEESGLEYRHFAVDDTLEVYLICAIDGTRFDKLLEIPQRDLLGYVVMIDSTDFDSWSMARVMMANCRGYALLPTMLVANKQDLPGAYTPEQVGGWIGMDSMVRVYPCRAIDPDSAREVFLQLLYLVNHEIDRLDALIAEIERMLAQDGEAPDSSQA